MATNVKGAEAKSETADMEAVKAQAVAEYKQRVASINGVFEGLDVSAEEKNNFIEDDSKTVADATTFALAKAKEQIKKLSAERDDFKAKAEKASAADAGLSEDQKLAIQKGLAAESSAANSVQGGAIGGAEAEDAETKAVRAAFKKGFGRV